MAVEEGTARVHSRGEPPTDTNYLAIHIKQDGKWLLESVRETAVSASTPGPTAAHQQLQRLGWLIGSWVDQDDQARIETTADWSSNGNFIERVFTVSIGDRIEVSGQQLIGWDADAGVIRSWVFDSHGGFGEGTWSGDGDRWIVKTRHQFHDGRRASAIRVLTPVDANHFTLEVVGREIDGQFLPNIDTVSVVRR